MSAELAGRVWASATPRRLKPLLANLADIGDHDGSNIFPSVAYLAWRLSSSERAVQQQLAEARRAGYIEAVCHAECNEDPGRSHGYEQAIRYHLYADRLPWRPSWEEERERRRKRRKSAAPALERVKNATVKGEESAPFSAKRVKNTTQKGEASCTRSVSDPSDPERESDPRATDEQRALALRAERKLASDLGIQAPPIDWALAHVLAGSTWEDFNDAIGRAREHGGRTSRYVDRILERLREDRAAAAGGAGAPNGRVPAVEPRGLANGRRRPGAPARGPARPITSLDEFGR